MSNRKKILFITPGGVGGAERITITYAKLLPSEEFDVQFVILGKERKILEFIPKQYPVEYVPFRNIFCLATLRIYLKLLKMKPNLVFSSVATYNPRVIIASRLANVKVIVRSSGMIGTYSKYMFYQVKFSYPLADMVIAQQNDMREEICKLIKIDPQKVVTIHNPLDYENINWGRKESSPFGEQDMVKYVNVARVNPAKGHDIAIRALKEVRKDIPNAHLYFVGYFSPEDVYYQKLLGIIKELELTDFVHFVGYDKNPYKWIAYCDCFVFPSRKEGLPNALIDASYIGVPCVATRCLRIINEIIQDGYNGYTVEVDAVTSFANAMEKAIKLKDFQMKYVPSDPLSVIEIINKVNNN